VTRRARRAVLLAATLAVAAGCGLFRGAINSSPALRFWLFSRFGAERMCPEILRSSAPLRLTPGGNAIGRFFPARCRATVDDARETITLDLGGTGYAWTPVAGRIGFSLDVAVEYRPDFRLEEDAVYVFARLSRVVAGPSFALGSVENPLVDLAARGPLGPVTTGLAGEVVRSQLASGFTVVRTDQGDEFSLGILVPPARPVRPFVVDGERVSLVNETVELRPGGIDFVGPLRVEDEDLALEVRTRLAGPPLDALLVPRSWAEPLRDALQQGGALPLLPGYPIAALMLEPGGERSHRFPVPEGEYVLLVDHSARLGRVAPSVGPFGLLGAGAAVLSLSVELVEQD